MSEPNINETDTLSYCDTAVGFSLDVKCGACELLGLWVKASHLLHPSIYCALQGVHSSLLHQKDLQVKDLDFAAPFRQHRMQTALCATAAASCLVEVPCQSSMHIAKMLLWR